MKKDQNKRNKFPFNSRCQLKITKRHPNYSLINKNPITQSPLHSQHSSTTYLSHPTMVDIRHFFIFFFSHFLRNSIYSCQHLNLFFCRPLFRLGALHYQHSTNIFCCCHRCLNPRHSHRFMVKTIGKCWIQFRFLSVIVD